MPDSLCVVDGASDGRNAGRVAILLSTYNGAQYLKAQLDSLIEQTYQNWEIHASDDGSSDGTLQILDHYRQRLGGRLSIYRGPGKGFAANFLSLIRREEIQASYFAFCDQDDIWAREKLSSAVSNLEKTKAGMPALYCSRTRLVDESGAEIGYSALFAGRPCFENALVQSIAGGNTMVLNESARWLILRTPVDSVIISHDWWAYLLVSGSGGSVHYDPVPQVDYRQHSSNLMGSNRRLGERLLRLKKMFDGTFQIWNTANLTALEHFREDLQTEHVGRIDLFQKARRSALPMRLICFKRAGIYRQSTAENVILVAAALVNRL